MTGNIEGAEDIYSIAEAQEARWLAGFWDERHNTLSPVPEELMPGVAQRAKRYLDILSKTKWMVIEEWDQWMFEAEASR